MPDVDDIDENDDIEGASGAGGSSANGPGGPVHTNGTPAAFKPRTPRNGKHREAASHTQEARGGIGIGRVPTTGVKGLDKPFENSDAEYLWPEVLERLRANDRSEYQCQVRVERVAPGEKVTLGTFECSAIVGDESVNPGDALRHRVTDDYHLVYSQWPAIYNLIFVWKINGQMLTRGRLSLPAPAQIRAQREHEERKLAASGQAPPGYGANGGFGAPPQAHAQPPYAPPQAPPYYPPPAGDNSEVARLRAELAQAAAREEYYKGITDEIRRANAEGRAANIPPPPQAGYGAPPAASLEERLASSMERGFGRLAEILTAGRFQQPPPPVQQQVAPPPPPPAPPPPRDPLKEMSERLTQKMLERTLERVADSMEKTMAAVDNASAGLGAPPPAEEPSTELAPVEPEDDKPWKGYPTDAKWSDGRPVIFPKAKEGGFGGIHPMGALFENPILAETMMGGLNNIMESAAEAIKKVASGESTHVVRRVPQNAQPAGSTPAAPTTSPVRSSFDE